MLGKAKNFAKPEAKVRIKLPWTTYITHSQHTQATVEELEQRILQAHTKGLDGETIPQSQGLADDVGDNALLAAQQNEGEERSTMEAKATVPSE